MNIINLINPINPPSPVNSTIPLLHYGIHGLKRQPAWFLLSPPVRMHGGLLASYASLSVYLSGRMWLDQKSLDQKSS